ncbi:phage holin [Loigolactobacillus bifermentans]|nr:phage holin [Loigolactobacillus bifermentans]QGG60070.1 phage holin [Loigolactobacillus bifermentans]
MDWKARVKNKTFWVALVPAVLLLLQVIAVPFGYKLDIVILSKQLLGIINAVFGVLVILGIIADPTTTGITDKGAK